VREVETPLPEGVACERTYQVVIGGVPQPLLCRWFVPEPHPEGSWDCRVEITWPNGRVRKITSGGVDSAQAMILAFSYVATEILANDASIYWFDEHDDLSLPCSDHHAEEIAARKARFDGKDKMVPPESSEC
jgi:hypothetical protein